MEEIKSKKNNILVTKTISMIESWQQIIYISSGLAFLLIGIGIFVYSLISFYHLMSEDFLHAILILINDLLLLLIIMEVMETIINHLKHHTILLEPFLFMGIITATRKILAAGAKVTIVENISDAAFKKYLMDLGVNALVILALTIALYLFSRRNLPHRERE
ncbi:MAG: phosphate-starvation-inducible PsiE family protein [Nitrospirota bacterium]